MTAIVEPEETDESIGRDITEKLLSAGFVLGLPVYVVFPKFHPTDIQSAIFESRWSAPVTVRFEADKDTTYPMIVGCIRLVYLEQPIGCLETPELILEGWLATTPFDHHREPVCMRAYLQTYDSFPDGGLGTGYIQIAYRVPDEVSADGLLRDQKGNVIE